MHSGRRIHRRQAEEKAIYPTLIRIGSFEISSFGALVAAGALAGFWLFRRELRLSRLPAEWADVSLAAVIAGLVGAKLLWASEHAGEAPFMSLVLSRAGLSWFGGLAAGVGTGLWLIRRRRLPVLTLLAAATPALALGHAIGRVGCFLVGDDYGVPSSLPWAVAFPDGSPPTTVAVHPTQLYEALALMPIMGLMLRWRRQGAPDAWVLGSYFALTGVLRFGIEFIRVNDRVALGLTVAQWASLAIVVVGLTLARRSRLAGSVDRR
jgi:phosphatidylglycerol:prolipoprotein diacylglycerol transferase